MAPQQLNLILELASSLMRKTSEADSPLKPTNFFNEGWMTALTLAIINDHHLDVPPFRVYDGGRWWCEAGLRSQFKPSKRGDKKGEGSTWVDAVLGHFDRRGKRGIQLRANATQFAVIEAKLEARLSSNTSNAKDYDQAARNVACMVKELEPLRDRMPGITSLSYRVVAPEKLIECHRHLLTRESIERKVRARIDDYETSTIRDAHMKWFDEDFLPFLHSPQFQLEPLKWEEVIDQIKRQAADLGQVLDAFYQQCLETNRKPKPGVGS